MGGQVCSKLLEIGRVSCILAYAKKQVGALCVADVERMRLYEALVYLCPTCH